MSPVATKKIKSVNELVALDKNISTYNIEEFEYF